MRMDKMIVCALFLLLFLLILCVCCYLAGYKKGTQDIAKFHNSVWKVAEKEAVDGEDD